MSFVTSGKLGNIQTNREQLLREEILDRYQHIGGKRDERGNWINEGQNWLKGLDGHVRDNIALLYENQAKYFRSTLNEATESGSSGGFEAQAFPMIRRIYSRLLVNDIVSVQAMTQPTGALFFYYPNISERIVSGSTSDHAPSVAKLPTCTGFNCPDVTYAGCKSLYDRFYNDALYDHSKGSFTIISASGTPVQLDANSCWVPATGATLAQDGSIRQMKFRVDGFKGRTTSNPNTLNNFTARTYRGNGLEVDTEEFLASFTVLYNGATNIVDPKGNIIYKPGDAMNFRLPAQAYGKGLVDISDICDENGNLYVEIDLTHPLDCATCDSFDGYIGATGSTVLTGSTNVVFAWRRYEPLENETEIGEVTFEIKKVTVSVESRKLRARWTPELATDIQAYHNIDAEAELTALMSEQIAMEIDRQVLRELKRGAAWKLRWNYFGWKSTGAQKYTQKEWNQTLITRINQISAQIHKSTLRGGANFLVVSSEVSAIFDDLDAFLPTSHDLEDYTYNLGIKQIGTLSSRYKIFVDPYAPAGDILIGHKGTSLLDTGYIYAPYLPLQLTPTITDPNTLTMVKGIATRYASKMINSRYYGVVTVDSIQTFNTIELR